MYNWYFFAAGIYKKTSGSWKGREESMMNRYLQYMYSYPHKTAYRPLSGISLHDYAPAFAGGGHGLYVHIPFCQAKCGYCNLFSVTGQDGEALDRYLEAVYRQSSQYAELLSGMDAAFSSLVAGGGTPLYLSAQQLDKLFCRIKKQFRFAKQPDFVIETAPNQTDAQKLALLKQHGVTRVSMGIQSFHDAELAALGRAHRAAKAREALGLLKTAGFACVNTDFIYGIPGQTAESLLASLKEAVRFEPDEIFLYPLYVKHGAGLQGEGIVPDQEQAFLQYQHASCFLREEGYFQKSMRRFVRSRSMPEPEFHECGFGNSLALGCGGRSYAGNLHFCSPYAVTQKECLGRIREFERTADYTQVTHGCVLSDGELKRRYVIRHLFLYPGLPMGRYQEVFGNSALQDFPVLSSWLEQGFVTMQEQDASAIKQNPFLALTETGLGLSDYLGPQLISEPVRQAMAEWDAEYGG